MLKYEMALWDQGILNVAGVDEAGRGCFAGPIVAAAVSWNPEITTWKSFELNLINDSKKLSEKNRNILSKFIIENCAQYKIIELSNKEIDKYGIGKANKKALQMAVSALNNIDHVLVDHFSIKEDGRFSIPETAITKGDSKSISIASASIIAKVYRDNLMKNKYNKLYPHYEFNTNVGYGTKRHRDAIKILGLCPIHRKSYNIC